MINQTIIAECQCGSLRHVVGLYQFSWLDEEPELFIQTLRVLHEPLWKRLWIAAKYVLRVDSLSLNETIVTQEDARRIGEMMRGYGG